MLTYYNLGKEQETLESSNVHVVCAGFQGELNGRYNNLLKVQAIFIIIIINLILYIYIYINLSQASTLLVIHKIITKLSQMKTNHYFPVRHLHCIFRPHLVVFFRVTLKKTTKCGRNIGVKQESNGSSSFVITLYIYIYMVCIYRNLLVL